MGIQTMLFLIICLILISSFSATTYTINKAFFTDDFTENDINAWGPFGASIPNLKLSSCQSRRLVGGYNIFVGDTANPSGITRSFSGLISHFSIRIRANLYKLDSWPNNTIFFMVDGVTAYLQTFTASNGGTTDFCGNPSPITNTVNTNYNDLVVPIDITVSHTSSTFTLKILSNLIGSSGSWGIRDLHITMEACDESCLTCTNLNSCASCGVGLTLSGAFCTCTNAALKRQKIVPCSIMPCVLCIAGCTSGYYLSTVTTFCEPCNIACSACTSPVNSQATCSSCSPTGFISGTPGVQGCLSCFLGCQQCLTTVFNSCTTCIYGYFLTNLNTCATQCPSLYYGQQSTKMCIACANPDCATCIGNYGVTSYCSSCINGYYLFEYVCYVICPSGLMGYQGNCIATCPQRTFPNAATSVCLACIANCLECSNTLTCFICQTTAYAHNSVCLVSCPAGTYAETTNKLCLSCHSDCSLCNGPFSNNCLACSVVTKFLILGTCYISCPSFTYVPTCGLCSSTCLTCNGPASTNCLSCFTPSFLHLNISMCLTECNKGQISNNQARTCLTCLSQQVASFGECVACSQTCKQCNGVTFLQCTSCVSSTSLLLNTCVLDEDRKVIYAPHLTTQSLTNSIIILMGIHLILAFLIEFPFKYKTNLLYTIQLLQILSYTQFLTIQLSKFSQKSAYILYYTNFASFLSPTISEYHPKIPTKFLLLNKSGFYIVDSLGCHFVMITCTLVFLLTKYLSTRYKPFQWLYKKINSYIISYIFRLIVLDLFLNIILFFYCFSLSSGKGIGSIILLLIDVIILISSFCWKIKTEQDGSQVALFYYNQIGQNNEIQESYLEVKQKVDNLIQQKIKNNKIMPSYIEYLYKFPIPITIFLFVGSPTTQSICYIIYFIFFFILTVVMPYRRKIHKFNVIFGGIILLLNALGVVLVARMQLNSYYFEVLWFVTLLLLNIQLFAQIIVNYQFFKSIFSYYYYKIKKGENLKKQTKKENKESNSSQNDLQMLQDNKRSKQNLDQTLNFEKIDNSNISKFYKEGNGKAINERKNSKVTKY